MNFSHGSYEYHQSVIDNTRAAAKQSPTGRPLAIALDTKGPEIRTGLMTDDKDVPIPAGHELWITTDKSFAESGNGDQIYVDYPNLVKVTGPGKLIFVDDGILSLQVISIDGDRLRVRSLNNGVLSSRKGVNLPRTPVDLPALSEKDKKDIEFGVKNGVDMIFASFIRRADDIRHIRQVLGTDGEKIKIIAKIENEQGLQNFDEILRETDGVMVARGDLGIEIPASQVFLAQKMMIAKCNVAGKPVIVATQMLESMTVNPRPTRAEVSDVANAVLDGGDCVMLSGETAKGSYPIEAGEWTLTTSANLTVKMMAETAYIAESAISYGPLFDQLRQLTPRPTETAETLALAAVSASHEQDAGAIIVLSTSGVSARLISKYRPSCPIICGEESLLFFLTPSDSQRADCSPAPPFAWCLSRLVPRAPWCPRGEVADRRRQPYPVRRRLCRLNIGLTLQVWPQGGSQAFHHQARGDCHRCAGLEGWSWTREFDPWHC